MRLEDFDNRPTRLALRAFHLLERRGFHDPQADHEPDNHQDDADQERHAPAPGQELVLRHPAEEREHDRGCQQPGRHADLRPAAVETALVGRRMLDGHQHRAAPLAAHAESLHEPKQDQEDGRPRADGLVGRQQAYERGGDAHDHQREHQHRLAAHLVAVMADHDAADRARHEADGIGAERGHRARQRVEVREEEFVEHERGGRVVEEEVVPLDRRADQAGKRDESDRALVAAQLVPPGHPARRGAGPHRNAPPRPASSAGSAAVL